MKTKSTGPRISGPGEMWAEAPATAGGRNGKPPNWRLARTDPPVRRPRLVPECPNARLAGCFARIWGGIVHGLGECSSVNLPSIRPIRNQNAINAPAVRPDATPASPEVFCGRGLVLNGRGFPWIAFGLRPFDRCLMISTVEAIDETGAGSRDRLPRWTAP